MSILCIFHKSCADGFGAALAVKVYFDQLGKECEFLPAHYNDPVPDVTGKNVIIVDFSYSREVLLKMEKQADTIVVLDHHVTAQKELEGLSFCHFDMNKSGAMMAWEHFHPDKEVPLLIKYVQDRDLWRWELPNSKEVSAGLWLQDMNFDNWSGYLADQNIPYLVEQGRTILEYQEKEVERATAPDRYKMIYINGYEVPIMNTTTLISEICGKLAEGRPFAVTYFDTPTERVYSLRSRDGGIDVSEVAKTYGGGGHPRAAGFTLPLSEAF